MQTQSQFVSNPNTAISSTSFSLPVTASNYIPLSLPVAPITTTSVITCTSTTYTTTVASTIISSTIAPTVTSVSHTCLDQGTNVPTTITNVLSPEEIMQIDEHNTDNNHEVLNSNVRIIKPLGLPIMFPITDEIQSLHTDEDLMSHNLPQSTSWSTLTMDEKLLQIMNGISNVQTTCKTFQLGYNSLVNKCTQLESKVRLNREYIAGVNDDLMSIDKVATVAFNAVKVAEIDIQNIHATLSTSDTQFFARETVISGIPAHCQMAVWEVAERYLIAIGAEHLISHVTEVRELKTKNVISQNQEFYKLVLKFSSFQVRKDIMALKRRRGKITYADLFPTTTIPQDANKILYFNDLLPVDLYKRYTYIVKFFKLNKEISIFCNEGQVFYRRYREPPVLIPNDFDLNLLHTL